MPSISVIDTTSYGTRVVINDLTFAANTYDYFEVEIWDYAMVVYSGSTVRWSESLTGNYAWTDIAGLTPNTGYTFKGFVRWQGGTRNHVGNVSFTTLPAGGGTDPDPPGPTRPSNWNWTSLMSSVQTNPNMTYFGTIPLALVNASEWNSFCDRINEFRAYKGLSPYVFTRATTGHGFTRGMYNEAVNALSPMATFTEPSGYYSKLETMKIALNYIN
jgi:hypothetical protein